MKKGLIISLTLVSVFILTGCGKKEEKQFQNLKEEKLHTNTNKEVIKDQEISGIKISNASVVYESNQSTLTVQITNNSNLVVPVDSVVATYTFDDGTTSILDILIGTPLVPQQSVSATSSTSEDLSKAVTVKYDVKYSE